MKTALVLLFGFLLFACNRPQSGQESTAPPDSLPAGATDSLVTDSAPLAPEPEPPPLSRLDYDTTQWADIALLDSTILIDMKYATTDNFVQEQMYECGRCFLRPEVAKAVVAAQHELRQQGLGLKMLDCYRPRPIQWKLWEKAPDPRYVSDPRKGSMHNRGAAVDLTLVETSGRELDMGTPYDFFGPEAARDLESRLQAMGKDVQLTIHDAGHAFMNETDAIGTYDAELAAQVWPEAVGFLHGQLG